MIRTFKSKSSPFFHVLIFIFLIATAFCFWVKWSVAGVVLIIADIILIKSLLSTEYVLTDGVLIIRSGVLPERILIVEDIVSIDEAVCLRPSYALSSKGVIITTADSQVFVSPYNRSDFVKALRRLNEKL